MKIYANDNIIAPFEQFIGKDIWVKCRIDDDEHYNEDKYIRFYSIDDQGLCECTCLSEDKIKNFPSSRNWFCIKQMSEIDVVDLADVTIIKPLTTFTSQELYADYSSDAEELLDYVGTDLWIKVEFADAYFAGAYYINILSANGITLECKIIDAAVLEDNLVEKYEYDRLIKDFNNNYTETANAHMVKICRPVSVLTDEDVTDMLESTDTWDGDAW